ncbi:hypothetical protein VV02_24095 [Luteipulveratus mongoliensis]|uniref:Uncharacterized protein n=1 Tax=Luteipulveratus mongoliensis TaxID=571913 RepID=A0A0K1JNR7_9MICO|nr:hypothetical protein VV02_24095 [Luteipulveratus mongoliensis]
MPHALSRPSIKEYIQSNDTNAYVAPFQIKDKRGRVLNTFPVQLAVARKTQNIITAYPVGR